MASSSPNVDLSRFLAPGFSEEDMEKSRITVTSRCSDPVLVQMLMNGTHADITLQARGGSVRAHKCVLATLSPDFTFKINYGMTSAVDMKEMSIETLQLFVLLIYISCEERMNPAMLELREAVDRHFRQLYEAAVKYEVMERLSALFADALPRNLSPKNCWDLYRISMFQDICHEYILYNFKEVSASEFVLLEMAQNPELVQLFMVLACDLCKCPPVKRDQHSESE